MPVRLPSLHMILNFVRRNLIADLSGVIYWLRSVCLVSDGWACWSWNGGKRVEILHWESKCT